MSYSKKKLDPVSEEMAQLEKDRNEPPRWTTGEVAAATSRGRAQTTAGRAAETLPQPSVASAKRKTVR